MQEAIEKLRAFHAKNRFPLDVPVHRYDDDEARNTLNDLTCLLQSWAGSLERLGEKCNDIRIHRVQLMIEELAELVEAMLQHDEVAMCDGVGDLLFVTIGTSETFGLPTRDCLLEVCNSNLTKAPRQDGDHRLRNKGASFVPPDMKGVLNKWRSLTE